jgi:hypothetical protein
MKLVDSAWLGEASIAGDCDRRCSQGLVLRGNRTEEEEERLDFVQGYLYGGCAGASSLQRARGACQREGEAEHGVVVASSAR